MYDVIMHLSRSQTGAEVVLRIFLLIIRHERLPTKPSAVLKAPGLKLKCIYDMFNEKDQNIKVVLMIK